MRAMIATRSHLVSAVLFAAASVLLAAEKTVITPRFDPPDQPFRVAPMPPASRSIVVPISTNLHLAFDTQLLRAHTVWRGRGLALFGPQYSRTKTPFICHPEGTVLWGMPPVCPWAMDKFPLDMLPRNASAGFKGISTKGGATTFIYEVGATNEGTVRVHESVRAGSLLGEEALVRRLEIGPCNRPLFFLAHAEMDCRAELLTNNSSIAIARPADVLIITAGSSSPLKWHLSSADVQYESEIFTEDGTIKGNPHHKVQGKQARAWLEIPPHTKPLTVEITMTQSDLDGAKKAAQLPVARPLSEPKMEFLFSAERDPKSPPPQIIAGDKTARASLAGNEFYRAEAFPLPKEIELLVCGMDWMPNGDLAVCTWLGDVYIVESAQGATAQAKYRRFARGLCEPLGLLVRDGNIYVAQKTELTRLTDTDGNGEADLFERVSADWDFTGSYNSFVYGPVMDKAGNFIVANAGHAGRWDARHMGWALRISADGTQCEPFASGLREPNGMGTFGPERDIFVTDNQGNWIGACKLNHLQPGKFFGHPSSIPAKKEHYKGRDSFDPPAIWFPYKLAKSSTGMTEIKDDRFGPFRGQLLVGDFQNALVTRVMLEKVEGEWQGAVWPFLKSFQSGVNRLSFGSDGNLYVGGCQRTWVAVAAQEAALERVSFTGKVPFTVKEVHALSDGFELIFTQPVDAMTAADTEGYDVSQYTYKFHASYGSPEFDHDGKANSATPIKVAKIAVAQDRMKVRLVVEGWKAGYVTTVRAADVRSASGKPLWHDTFWYTLNRIPKR